MEKAIELIDAGRKEIRELELLAEMSKERGKLLRRAEWLRCNVLALEIALWDEQGLR